MNNTNITEPATNAAAAATRAAASGGENYLGLIITIVVVGVIFGLLWRKGYLLRIRNYTAETQEELRKCTWPTIEELKGSTVVVMVTIALFGAFTVGVDWIFSMVIRLITA